MPYISRQCLPRLYAQLIFTADGRILFAEIAIITALQSQKVETNYYLEMQLLLFVFA